MTTPAGVPNLPIGALTVETLGDRLQNQSPAAMRSRAGEQMPGIFGASTGGNILADLSPFGILTAIWADINSRIAGADPVDIQGPEDLPPLFLDFIEGLPVIGQFVTLLEALLGTYEGDDPTLLGIQDLFGPIRTFIETVGQGIADFLAWIWDNFGTAVETFLKPVAEFLSWLWQGVSGGFGGFGDIVDSVLKPIFEWLHWVWLQFGSALDTFLKPIATLAKSVWDMFADAAAGIGATAESVLEDLWGFLSWLWNGVSGGFAGFSSSVEGVLKPAFEFLHWLFGSLFSGAVDTLKSIFTALEGLVDSAGSLHSWLDQVPLIGPLVSIITGKSPVDGVTMDLTTLGNWARDVLTGKSDIPAGQLKGLLPPGILSSIPLSNINFDTPNLLSQGEFGNAGTIEAQDGWSWDDSENHSSSGGSVKVACNGTARRLYSSQVIKVVAGDRINLSSYVKTSSDFAGSSSCIELILVPFAGTARYTVSGSPVNIYFNTRGTTSNAWAQMAGSTGTSTAPWTVPAGVTSVRVRVSVTSAATAGSVWFDDIDLHKTGLLSGEWMNGIAGTVAADFQAVVDKVIQAIKGTVAGGTGNPLNGILTTMQSIFSTLFNIPQLPTSLVSNPLLEIAVPGLQASKITSGSFGTARIADDAVTTAKIGPQAVTAAEIANSTITTTQFATATIPAIGTALGTAITTGSGGKISRTNTATKVTAAAGDNKFSAFFVDSAGNQSIDQISSDITSPANGRFTVTYAGYYIIELGFTTNASTPAAGYFNVAPAIFINGSTTPYKVGSDALGSFGGGFGNYSRTSHSTFIVYLTAGSYIEAGYRNFGASNANFFMGDANGNSTYFSIAMLNRTAEG